MLVRALYLEVARQSEKGQVVLAAASTCQTVLTFLHKPVNSSVEIPVVVSEGGFNFLKYQE